jgi:hypothetical protein
MAARMPPAGFATSSETAAALLADRVEATSGGRFSARTKG